MVTLERNEAVLSLASDQHFNHLPRVRATVNVVAKKDLHGFGGGPRFEVVINAGKDGRQEIGTPVDIANGINAPAGG